LLRIMLPHHRITNYDINFSQAELQAPWWWSQTETCKSHLILM